VTFGRKVGEAWKGDQQAVTDAADLRDALDGAEGLTGA
jgi:hypothetical protein